MAKNKDNPLKNELIETSDGTQKRRRATAAQKELRTQKVAQWLMDGWTRQEVIIEAQKLWGLSQRMVEHYITDANELIEYTGHKELEAVLAKQLLRLAEIYQSAFEEGDWKNALDVIKTESRLLGLNAPEKLETKIEEIASMTQDERVNRIEQFIKRAKRRDEEQLTN